MMNESAVLDRAMTVYRHACTRAGRRAAYPSRFASRVVECRFQWFAVVAGSSGTLAVYRVFVEPGAAAFRLAALKREAWPDFLC